MLNDLPLLLWSEKVQICHRFISSFPYSSLFASFDFFSLSFLSSMTVNLNLIFFFPFHFHSYCYHWKTNQRGINCSSSLPMMLVTFSSTNFCKTGVCKMKEREKEIEREREWASDKQSEWDRARDLEKVRMWARDHHMTAPTPYIAFFIFLNIYIKYVISLFNICELTSSLFV